MVTGVLKSENRDIYDDTRWQSCNPQSIFPLLFALQLYCLHNIFLLFLVQMFPYFKIFLQRILKNPAWCVPWCSFQGLDGGWAVKWRVLRETKRLWGSSYHRLYPLYFANISSSMQHFSPQIYIILRVGAWKLILFEFGANSFSWVFSCRKKILKVHEFSKDTIVITAAEVTARFFLRIKSVASSSYATL